MKTTIAILTGAILGAAAMYLYLNNYEIRYEEVTLIEVI